MRIFVYLLALLTGLSAAQNAGAQAAAPSLDVASAVSEAGQRAHAAKTSVIVAFWTDETPVLFAVADIPVQPPVFWVQTTRVYRGDRSHE